MDLFAQSPQLKLYFPSWVHPYGQVSDGQCPWRKICLSCMRWAPVPQPSSLLRGLPSCHQEWPSVVGPWQLQLQPRTFSLLTTVILYLIVISSILPHLCSNWSIYPIPMVLNWGWFCISSPTPCPEDISQCLESFLIVTTVDVLPASRRRGLGIPLSLLQCTEQAPFPPRQILELFLRVASCCSAPCLTNSQASQTPFSEGTAVLSLDSLSLHCGPESTSRKKAGQSQTSCLSSSRDQSPTPPMCSTWEWWFPTFCLVF